MNRELWDKCVGFHGHECPGLAIGFRACEAAVEKLGVSFSKDEEVVCITENNACGVDAVQLITGCTFGKGNRSKFIVNAIVKELKRQKRLKYISESDGFIDYELVPDKQPDEDDTLAFVNLLRTSDRGPC